MTISEETSVSIMNEVIKLISQHGVNIKIHLDDLSKKVGTSSEVVRKTLSGRGLIASEGTDISGSFFRVPPAKFAHYNE